MNENRRQILEMLSTGKITADEAERLIAALDSGPAPTVGEHMGSIPGPNGAPARAVKSRTKYLRVLVEADEQMTGMKGPTSVNIRMECRDGACPTYTTSPDSSTARFAVSPVDSISSAR